LVGLVTLARGAPRRAPLAVFWLDGHKPPFQALDMGTNQFPTRNDLNKTQRTRPKSKENA
jgi:hypothetical protein